MPAGKLGVRGGRTAKTQTANKPCLDKPAMFSMEQIPHDAKGLFSEIITKF